MGYYLKNTIRYWKTTINIILHLSKWSEFEITVDDLLDCINSNWSPLIIDIRTVQEFADGHIPSARSISLTELASNLENLQSFKEKEIVTICPGGGLSLVAFDILVKAGFKDVKSLRGDMNLWRKKGYPTTTAEDINYLLENIKPGTLKSKAKKFEGKQPPNEKYKGEVHQTLDARNLSCPKPILKSKKALKALEIGQVLEILTTDPGSKTDIPAWAHVSGQELISAEESGPKDYRFLIRRLK